MFPNYRVDKYTNFGSLVGLDLIDSYPNLEAFRPVKYTSGINHTLRVDQIVD
jgi:hypothetical protein